LTILLLLASALVFTGALPLRGLPVTQCVYALTQAPTSSPTIDMTVAAPHINTDPLDEVVRTMAPYFNDPRAWLSDFPGLKRLTDDQEKHVEAIRTCDTVGAMGAPGTGKSLIEGACALWRQIMRFPQSCYFGGPTEEGTAAQAWKHLTWAYNMTNERFGKPILGGELLRYSYSLGQNAEKRLPEAASHWARIKACPLGKDGATLRGQLHAAYALVVLQEVNGMDPSAVGALWDGTRAAGAAFWYSFNPYTAQTSRDSAKELWAKTSEAGRVQYSLIRALEWQDKHGPLPGMTDRATFERDILPLKDTALWYPLALGEYPPESAENVVVPKTWFTKCVNCIPEPTQADRQTTTLGIDTGGGRAETGGIGIIGRCVQPARASKETHDTIKVAVFMRDYARSLGMGTQAIVDWVGLGGKGTGEQLRAMGVPVLVFRGGARTVTRLVSTETEAEVAKCPEMYADLACWAWMSVREATRKTVEAIAAGRPDRYISFPDDPLLCDQLARRFDVDPRDKRYFLQSKGDSGKASPDRGDMVAMGWLAQVISRRQLRYDIPATGEPRAHRAERSERPDDSVDRKAFDPAMA
jgi:hypothetical protein